MWLADLLLGARTEAAHAASVAADLGEDLIPLAVKNLADSHDFKPVVGEPLGHRLDTLQYGSRLVAGRKKIDPSGMRIASRQEAGTRRITHR